MLSTLLLLPLLAARGHGQVYEDCVDSNGQPSAGKTQVSFRFCATPGTPCDGLMVWSCLLRVTPDCGADGHWRIHNSATPGACVFPPPSQPNATCSYCAAPATGIVCADGPMFRDAACMHPCEGWTRYRWRTGTNLCVN